MRHIGGQVGTGVMAMVLVLLSGCGYQSQFSCKGYPESASCRSVSENFDRRFEPSPPSQDLTQESHGRNPTGPREGFPPAPPLAGTIDSYLGKPVLVPADVLRVWIAPYQDSKGRLHDSAQLYVVLSEAHFVYGHRQGMRRVPHGARPGADFLPKTSRMVERASRGKTGGTGAASGTGSGPSPYQDLNLQDESRHSMAQPRVNGVPGAPSGVGPSPMTGTPASPVDPYGFGPNFP